MIWNLSHTFLSTSSAALFPGMAWRPLPRSSARRSRRWRQMRFLTFCVDAQMNSAHFSSTLAHCSSRTNPTTSTSESFSMIFVCVKDINLTVYSTGVWRGWIWTIGAVWIGVIWLLLAAMRGWVRRCFPRRTIGEVPNTPRECSSAIFIIQVYLALILTWTGCALTIVASIHLGLQPRDHLHAYQSPSLRGLTPIMKILNFIYFVSDTPPILISHVLLDIRIALTWLVSYISSRCSHF